MRRSLLLAASTAALMTLPAFAQEATTDQTTTDQTTTDQTTTDQQADDDAGAAASGADATATGDQATTNADAATTDTQATTGTDAAATDTQSTTGDDAGATGGDAAAATEEQPAQDGTVVTTAGDEAGGTGGDAAATTGDPMMALFAEAERLRDMAEQIQTGGGVTIDGAAGVGTDTTGAAADTVTADSAAATTDDEAVDNMQQMQGDAMQALDDFDAALTRVGSEGDQDIETQVATLQQQSQQVRQQLQDDVANVGDELESLADAALQLRVSGIPAEADTIVGRTVVSSDGEDAGEVTDILVTPDGRVAALVLQRGGALGLGGQQFAVTWDQLQIQGVQIMVNMTNDQIQNLPEYQTE